jgi:RNA polymerase sigma-32 factor
MYNIRPAPSNPCFQLRCKATFGFGGNFWGVGVWKNDDKTMKTTIDNRGDAVTQLLAEAKRFPMLTPEREQALARAWKNQGDAAALRELVGSHLRLAIKIARGFQGYGLPIGDLIAEGNVGLMQAAQKFDPDRGFRFATYAMWWIRAAIQEYILHSNSIVKMGTTAAQKKLFFNLRQMKGRLEQHAVGDLPAEAVETIATALGVPANDVVEMNRRMAGGDVSLNATMMEDGEMEWQDRLVDDSPTQEVVLVEADERAKRRVLLKAALTQLNDREREIVLERRLRDEPLTLDELSRRFHVSRERIRQIEVRAVEKLRKAMLGPAKAVAEAADLAAAA